jgi:hypothetical protein
MHGVLWSDNKTVALRQHHNCNRSACREALDDLVRLGFHYKQLQRFMQQEQQPCSQRSLYRQALCAGLAGTRGSDVCCAIAPMHAAAPCADNMSPACKVKRRPTACARTSRHSSAWCLAIMSFGVMLGAVHVGCYVRCSWRCPWSCSWFCFLTRPVAAAVCVTVTCRGACCV